MLVDAFVAYPAWWLSKEMPEPPKMQRKRLILPYASSNAAQFLTDAFADQPKVKSLTYREARLLVHSGSPCSGCHLLLRQPCTSTCCQCTALVGMKCSSLCAGAQLQTCSISEHLQRGLVARLLLHTQTSAQPLEQRRYSTRRAPRSRRQIVAQAAQESLVKVIRLCFLFSQAVQVVYAAALSFVL